MNPEAQLERLLERVDGAISSGEFMDVNHPGIPGADNRWFPSQGQARKIALVIATRRGPGHRIVHDASPALGQPHYHVVDPQGRRVSGHIFYGRRPPRRAYAGRPWRESESGKVKVDPWELPYVPPEYKPLYKEITLILNDRKINNYEKAKKLEDRFRKLSEAVLPLLYSELNDKKTPGTLGQLFNYRFATCTRNCLRKILYSRLTNDPPLQESCDTWCRRRRKV